MLLGASGQRNPRVTANQNKVILNDDLYATMEQFCPDGSGLNALIHRARGVTEWFDEYEDYADYMLWPSQST